MDTCLMFKKAGMTMMGKNWEGDYLMCILCATFSFDSFCITDCFPLMTSMFRVIDSRMLMKMKWIELLKNLSVTLWLTTSGLLEKSANWTMLRLTNTKFLQVLILLKWRHKYSGSNPTVVFQSKTSASFFLPRRMTTGHCPWCMQFAWTWDGLHPKQTYNSFRPKAGSQEPPWKRRLNTWCRASEHVHWIPSQGRVSPKDGVMRITNNVFWRKKILFFFFIGMLNIVNQLFKIYFSVNKLHLCKPLIRAIESSSLKDK